MAKDNTMLRHSLLYLSGADWARGIATHWPVAKRVARRFVAGETLDEAVEITQNLNQQGILVTLDYLGESIRSEGDAVEVEKVYLDLIDRIDSEKLEASISLKLTHIGFDISEELTFANLRQIVSRAKEYNVHITLDMESSKYTEDTLRIYRTLRDEYDFDNVGTVVQSYLRRTENDMHELAQENAHIRLCKGAYLEPPAIAFADKAAVDANFVKIMESYLTECDAYLCIATHDENMIRAAETIINKQNIPHERYEFQMLYGVRPARQKEIAAAGHKMRVYVPFGEAWYPYFVRRLAERPANLSFFLRSLLR